MWTHEQLGGHSTIFCCNLLVMPGTSSDPSCQRLQKSQVFGGLDLLVPCRLRSLDNVEEIIVAPQEENFVKKHICSKVLEKIQNYGKIFILRFPAEAKQLLWSGQCLAPLWLHISMMDDDSDPLKPIKIHRNQMKMWKYKETKQRKICQHRSRIHGFLFFERHSTPSRGTPTPQHVIGHPTQTQHPMASSHRTTTPGKVAATHMPALLEEPLSPLGEQNSTANWLWLRMIPF